MNLAPTVIEYGERFGKLTVLEKFKAGNGNTMYRCGCVCGFQKVRARAAQLMKGRVNACLKCASVLGTAKQSLREKS